MPLPTDLSQNALNNMVAAFEILIEEIEVVLHNINKAGSSAFEVNDYDGAYIAIERAMRIRALHQDISSLKEEWNEFDKVLYAYQKQIAPKLTFLKRQINRATSSESYLIASNKLSLPTDGTATRRIRRGLRTREAAFFCPILQALVNLGGSAKKGHVLSLVGQSMRDILKPVDYQTLSSKRGLLRWQNSAQWARNLMVKDGLLSANSPQGIWEITEAGRTFLRGNSH